MVFSSLKFIFIFLPIFFGCYYLVPDHWKNEILFLGSMCFYATGTIGHPMHFLIFVISMVLDFTLGNFIEEFPKQKKQYLTAGVGFHLISLGMFKYSGLGLTLPIGISFYTFQGISYLADVYRGKVRAEKSLLRYCVYISMFEQLIAGPIVTYSQVKENLRHRSIPVSTIANGIRIFILGLGLKVLLANPLGKLWTDVGNIGYESISTPLAWIAIFAFSFQIYFDFFGYSLMAMGLGRMLGFHLPDNFLFPYLSRSMTEFWRRWHITLGSWFREYVYIPLGGNRKGTGITVRNLFIVWTLTGIWHGAGWNFVLWGITLFVILVFEKFVIGKYLDRFPVLGHLYMLLLIPLSWTVFAIVDLHQMGIFFSRLFPFFGQGPWSVFPQDYLKYLKLYFPFLLAGVLMCMRFPFRVLKEYRKRNVMKIVYAGIFLGSVYCLYRGMNDPFLYFRF